MEEISIRNPNKNGSNTSSCKTKELSKLNSTASPAKDYQMQTGRPTSTNRTRGDLKVKLVRRNTEENDRDSGVGSLTSVGTSAQVLDIKTLIRNSVTMNLSSQDRSHLFRFVRSFIQSAEAKSDKVPPRSTIDYLVSYGGTGLLAGTSAGLYALGLKPLSKVFYKLVVSPTAEGIKAAQKDHHRRNHELIKMKIKQVIVRGNNPTEEVSMTRIFRLFYANIATDIFLRFKDKINAWCTLYDPDCIWIEDIGDFAGSRFFHKLKRVEDKGDAIKEFIRSRKSDSVLINNLNRNPFSRPCFSCLCSTPTVQVEGANFKNIFLKPVPAFFTSIDTEVRVKVDTTGTGTGTGTGPGVQLTETETKGEDFELLIRPPFEFEYSEMLTLLKMEQFDKLQPINFEDIFANIQHPHTDSDCNKLHSKKREYIWEDCTPLAIDIFEELETDEEFNSTKHIIQSLQKFMQQELNRQTQELRQQRSVKSLSSKSENLGPKQSRGRIQNQNQLRKASTTSTFTSTDGDKVDGVYEGNKPTFGAVDSNELKETDPHQFSSQNQPSPSPSPSPLLPEPEPYCHPTTTADHPVPHFVGRGGLLSQINKELNALEDSTSSSWSDKTVILTGCSGRGKTQVARKYAQDYLPHHKNIVWIDAENFESLRNSFLTAARTWEILKDDESNQNEIENQPEPEYDQQWNDSEDEDQENIVRLAQSLYQHFSKFHEKLSKKCLFIFDNVQSIVGKDSDNQRELFSIRPFLPEANNVMIPLFLLTSHNSKWDEEDGYNKVIPLKALPKNESMWLLRKYLDISEENSKIYELKKAMEDLRNELVGFPLGIEIAAANVLANVKWNPSSPYLDLVKNEIINFTTNFQNNSSETTQSSSSNRRSWISKSFKGARSTDASWDSEDILAKHREYLMTKILNVTFANIRNKYKTEETGKKALEVLHLMAFLATDHINAEVCYRIYYNIPPDHDTGRTTKHFPEDFNALLKILKEFGLISTEEKITGDSEYVKVNVHQLVQKLAGQILKENIFYLGKFLRSNSVRSKSLKKEKLKLHNIHSTRILVCLLTSNSPNDISLAACILSFKFLTKTPISPRLLDKIRKLRQSKNLLKPQVTVIQMFLVLYDGDIIENQSLTVDGFEKLIMVFVSTMSLPEFQNDIYIQFVGSISVRHLLCEHRMKSLISHNVYKNIQDWSLTYFENEWPSLSPLKDIWILVFENIFELYTKSEVLFVAGDSTVTAKNLVEIYTPDFESNPTGGYWSALFNAMYGSKNLPGFDLETSMQECLRLEAKAAERRGNQ